MLLGLHGRAGSGKDQSYRYIADWAQQHERPVRRDAFADRMKFSAARAIGYDGDMTACIAICDQLKQPGWEIIVREPDGRVEHVITGREYHQYFGTEAHRDVFGTSFWIDAVLDSYVPDAGELLVITDVRLPNEAEAIRDQGGEIWQIIRPGKPITEARHSSEQPLPEDLIDHVIRNTKDRDHLRRSVLRRLNTHARRTD